MCDVCVTQRECSHFHTEPGTPPARRVRRRVRRTRRVAAHEPQRRIQREPARARWQHWAFGRSPASQLSIRESFHSLTPPQVCLAEVWEQQGGHMCLGELASMSIAPGWPAQSGNSRLWRGRGRDTDGELTQTVQGGRERGGGVTGQRAAHHHRRSRAQCVQLVDAPPYEASRQLVPDA